MVWGFGGKPPLDPQIAVLNNGNGGAEDQFTKKDQEKAKNSPTYRFDSAALERAAKAAKDLEKSPHAKELLELTKAQEITKQLELQNYSLNIERLKYEEQRKMLDQQNKLAQQKAQYEDKLARARYKDQLEEQKRSQDEKHRREQAHQEEISRKQCESIKEQEKLKRQTIDYEVTRKSEEETKRIQADYKSRAIYERENFDIHQEQVRLQAEENRQTVIHSIEKIGSILGQGFKQFIVDWDKVRSTALGLTLIAGGIYTAKYSVSIIGKTIESRIGKPKLLRETSRLNAIDILKHPITSAKRIHASRRPQDALRDVILKPTLEEKLRDIAIATRNTKINKSFYRNLMFFGPPGTGKTLFAKKLAQHSGMDYAILSGGDVAPLGRDGVTAIHKVFDWSTTSRRGLLLFIDEAEAFLSERRTGKLSEELKHVVDAFLYRTGEQSNKFMLVLSTNIPEHFDKSVIDRVDKSIKFETPSLDERKRLVTLYFEKYVLEPASKSSRRGLKVDSFEYVEVCNKIAEMIEGLSGRAISKLGVAWQAAAFATANRLLTEDMVIECVNEAIEEYKERQKWNNAKPPELSG